MTRPTRFSPLIFMVIALALHFAAAASSAAPQTITATLIRASQESGAVDKPLKKYERHLKRLFKHSSYQLVGQASRAIESERTTTIELGKGHKVLLDMTPAKGDKSRIKARWARNNRILVDTTVVMAPGAPTVLGGPATASGKGNFILILALN